MEWLVVEEQGLDQLEKAFGVELEEPFQKLRGSDKSNDVEHVHSPFESAESA